jgi:hypothetical protein
MTDLPCVLGTWDQGSKGFHHGVVVVKEVVEIVEDLNPVLDPPLGRRPYTAGG